MIYRKSFLKEIGITAMGIFVVLFVILVSTQSINLLGRATQGRVAVDAVFALIGFWSLGLFPVLLVLTIFISLLTVFTRYWRDLEMSVWLSCGLSLKNWIRPVLNFSIPFALIVGMLSLYVTPWAAQRSKEYAETLKQREELSVVAPGVFKEIGKQKRVYFVEKFSPDSGAAENIFIQDVPDEKNRNVLIFAQTGYLLTEDGDRKLVLENGHRYIGSAGESNFEVLDFERFITVIDQEPKIIAPIDDRRTIKTSQILNSANPEFQAELVWRLSLPISIVLLSMMAVPLSYYNPRTGHTYNLFFALVAYLVYQNGLTFVRDFIESGQLAPWTGFFMLHGSVAIFILIAFRYRLQAVGPFWATLKNTLKFKL